METDNWTPLDWAKYYDSHGLCVIPAIDGRPRVSWKDMQDERPSEAQLNGWFRGESFRKLQIFIVCGRVSNVVVVDCDSPQAEDFWRELVGADLLDTTARSLSGGGRGHHYWFRLGDQDQEGRSSHKDDVQWDLRGQGGGVVVPPSPHRSGGTYTWEVSLSEIKDWPYPEIPGKGISSHQGGDHASSLAYLLANPGEGGRNNWVTAVLGHYAKSLRFQDGYEATAEFLWHAACDIPASHPYEREEFDRTVESVWETEQRKWGEADAEPTEATGYLASGGNSIYTMCNNKDQGRFLSRYTNFDMRAESMIEDPDGRVAYVLNIRLGLEDGDVERTGVVLPGEKLGSNDQLGRWMASHRMITNTPKSDMGQHISRATRLQMYLESQSPRVLRSSPWMGWYDDPNIGPVYVTEEGLIDHRGLIPRARVGLVPDPRRMSAESMWSYQFGDPDLAAAALRELMTFHDPVATSVFGAVWAMAPIKGAIMAVSSLFPHMAVIAPSEAGKTNGYFDLMLQANGRLSVGGTYTPASLRDDLARHRGGFVWIDDPANIDDLGDLLRGAAGESIHSRKGGANWSETISTHLVAPIVLSAEGLEMLKERAMADRVIELSVPSPVGRPSRYTPGRPQWDDIVAYMNTVGHLSQFAGNYVQRSFQWLESIGGPKGLRQLLLDLRQGSGRMSEKIALVRAGARCLQYQLGDAWEEAEIEGVRFGGGEPVDVIAVVDAWALGEVVQAKTGPYLTSVVMPTFLSDKGHIPSFRSVPHEPMFLDRDGILRVNVPSLSQWWMRHARFRTDRDRAQQLGAPNALRTESQSMDWVQGSPLKGKRYLIVDPETTRRVLEEAGWSLDDAIASAKQELENGVLDNGA